MLDVKLLANAAVSFHVFLGYLATIGCHLSHLEALVGCVERLCLLNSAGASPRPWMSAVLDCARDPAAAHHLLLHGPRVLAQACTLGMVRHW